MTKNRTLWELTVVTTPQAEEAVAELLQDLTGRAASAFSNAETNVSRVSVFLPRACPPAQKRKLQAGLQRLNECGVNIGGGQVASQKIPRENWAESWKRHFQPIDIGGRLLVKPSWIRRRPRAGQAVVVLDPGLSFGTGQHPTTLFCLEQLVAHRTAGRQSLLDIGTGSGILAIAADKLGYRPVRAFDFDPQAVAVAVRNARQNRSRAQITRRDLTRLPLSSRIRYDVICANLIYDILIAERARILNRLQPDGVLVLAGILPAQFPAVQAAWEQMGMKLTADKVDGEWRSGVFRRAR